MVVPKLEAELAEPVGGHFARQGFDVWYEVPFNGRIADVVAVKGEEVVAVELKLRDWRGAHRQAVAYQVGCHRSFLGLPLPTALDCLRRHGHALRTTGTGLLAVQMPQGDVRELLPARLHEERFLPFLADALKTLGADRGA
ncbi:MAG TPA: hypothetical protein VHH36_02555 [Candidatus Thermoplasmatota archaeon]|nr:hypothetical protein [Candidatus Thermoplasmatota archaeon]